MPANSRDIIFQHSALTHRLDVLATDAIRVTDPLFVEHTGCTIREYRVLRMIDEHGGITFKDILVITGLDRSLVSRLIRILLERQLIYRVNSEQDARRFGLFTSETGRQRCQKGRELSAAAENILLAALAPQEMVALNSMLEKLFVRVSSANYAEQLQALSVRA
ncbi:MAG: MarR family transcriptional regulator [Thiothrix sp.]|nr:MarR family transcriptional regulator [Thiothrix sp.]HPQ97775.1 MarR family transcriptional regulator [Thiolinea sp.]